MLLSRILAPLFTLALLSSPLFATPQKITEVEGISEYRLPNGLQILLAPDAAKPVTTVNITYRVGSRHENYGETGMAHLLEHLLFKGTPKHPNIPQELSKRGMRPNGTTWFDRTNYFETFTASDDNLQWALQMEADRMVNSFVARKDLDSEMTVVRNEMERGENSPVSVLYGKVIAAAYQWHNYGHTTIGARSDVEKVRIENLQAFYRKYYQPDNATLVVAGKFDTAKTLAWVEQYFGAIPKPQRELTPTWTEEPTQDGERSVTLERSGETRHLTVFYHTPAGSHPDAIAIDLLANIMGDTPNGRLYPVLIGSKKATGMGAYQMDLAERSQLLFSAAMRKDDQPAEVRQLLLETIENTARKPVSETEVADARRNILTQYDNILSDPNALAITLSSSIALGDWRLLFWQRDQLEKTTAADVNRVAQKYLRASNRTIGEFIPTAKPERADIPPANDIARLLQGYQGKAAMAAGEDFDPSPAHIEARTQKLTLANGLQVALLPKKNKGETLQLSFNLHMGTAQSLFGKDTVFDLASAMLMRGSARHSREAIARELDVLRSQMRISGSGQTVSVAIQSRRASLPGVLALLREILREPAFPADEFEQIKKKWRADIESARQEPDNLSQQALLQHLHGRYKKGELGYAKSYEEQLAELDQAQLADVKALYHQLYGASHGQLAIVGDFDAAATRKLLTEYFGDWKNPTPYVRSTEPYAPIAALEKNLATPDKQNAAMRAALTFPLNDRHADYPALLVASQILGGGFLNSRLAERLRQKEGLSYSAYAYLSAPSEDDNGGLYAYAIYAPQNRARLAAAFREELARAVKDGFTAEEVRDAQTSILQNSRVSRTQDGTLAARLASNLRLQRDFGFTANNESKIAALTVDEVNATLRRYLKPEAFSYVFAGDFKQIPATR